MGELAERYWNTLPANIGPSQSDVYTAIVAMEARLAELEASHFSVGGSRVVQFDEDGNQRILPSLSDRLIAAERRADELLAAVSQLVQTQGRAIALLDVRAQPETEWQLAMGQKHYTNVVPGVDVSIVAGHPALTIAVISHDASPPNPELLEGASVQLMQRYTEAKAAADAEAARLADERENAAFRATLKDPDADAVEMTMRWTP